MKQKHEEKIFENCLILEATVGTVLVQVEDKKIVAKTNENLEKGERVSVSKVLFLPKYLEILTYLLPIIFFAFSFGFGFFVKSELVHYFVTLGASLFGILAMFLLKTWFKYLPKNKYIAKK